MAEKYILNQIPGFEIGAVGHIRTMMVVEASWRTCERCGTTEGVTTNLEGYEAVWANGVWSVQQKKELFKLYGANMDLGNKLDMAQYR